MTTKSQQKKYDAPRAGQRTRSWTCVIYPESAPQNWREVLDDEHIQWVESPLHDKDIDATGELKKPHWHVLLMFECVKNAKQVKSITDKLNAPLPQKCAGAKALVRYMAHLDNPDKAQYDKSLIIGHGGADVAALLKPTASSRYQLIAEMLEYIQSADIIEFEDIVTYAMHERADDWFPLLCDSCAVVVSKFLSSRRHRLRDDGGGDLSARLGNRAKR